MSYDEFEVLVKKLVKTWTTDCQKSLLYFYAKVRLPITTVNSTIMYDDTKAKQDGTPPWFAEKEALDDGYALRDDTRRSQAIHQTAADMNHSVLHLQVTHG